MILDVPVVAHNGSLKPPREHGQDDAPRTPPPQGGGNKRHATQQDMHRAMVRACTKSMKDYMQMLWCMLRSTANRLHVPLCVVGIFDLEELHMLNRATGMGLLQACPPPWLRLWYVAWLQLLKGGLATGQGGLELL